TRHILRKTANGYGSDQVPRSFAALDGYTQGRSLLDFGDGVQILRGRRRWRSAQVGADERDENASGEGRRPDPTVAGLCLLGRGIRESAKRAVVFGGRCPRRGGHLRSRPRRPVRALRVAFHESSRNGIGQY